METCLSEAFAGSKSCPRCSLSGGLGDFAEWRATALRQVLDGGAGGECWERIMKTMETTMVGATMRTMASAATCLCPFVVTCGGGGGALQWRPASLEAACLLTAQTASLGVDLQLRSVQPRRRRPSTITTTTTTIECHAFLMGSFSQACRSGSWPAAAAAVGLMKEEEDQQVELPGERLVLLKLDCQRYPLEVLQFALHSAYGHVLSFGGRPATAADLDLLRTVADHVTNDAGSVCRHLMDASGLLANIIVLLERLVREFHPAEDANLLPQLMELFRVSRLFNDLQCRLLARIRTEARRQLVDSSDGAPQVTPISCLHACEPGGCGGKDCAFFDLAVELFHELVLADGTVSMDSSLTPYLASLVTLYETDRCHAVVKACRDLRCLSGLLCLIGAPCSTTLADLCSHLAHLCHTLMQLVCDQAVLNIADALCATAAAADDATEAADDCRFVASLAQPVIAALNRLGDSQEQIGLDLLRTLRADLGRPELASMLEYRSAKVSLAAAKSLAADIKARDLRSIAYASYTAGRQPLAKLMVQAVALLLGEDADEAVSSDDAQRLRLCSEGRRILCEDGRLAQGLRKFSAELPRQQGSKWRRQLMEQLNCSLSTASSSAEQPPDGWAPLLAWVRAATRCAVLLGTTRCLVAVDLAAFASANRDFFLARADELLAGGEMEPDRRDALASSLMIADAALQPPPDAAAGPDQDHDNKDQATSFVMRLVPNLRFQFVAAHCH